MNIVVFDTETTSLDKPFCYNIGYVIINEEGEKLLRRDYVVEQIWHNLPLFSSAYYAEKRPIYVERMKARKVVMDKFGYICAQMRRDFKAFSVNSAYAYNSSFDEKVFSFNCDWFKCINPFEEIPVFDIRGYVHQFIVNQAYKDFCEKNRLFTESGNYSTTAEAVMQYLSKDMTFEEEHTALADSIIEADILNYCIRQGARYDSEYVINRSVRRRVRKTLRLKAVDKSEHFFEYEEIRISKDKTEITLR